MNLLQFHDLKLYQDEKYIRPHILFHIMNLEDSPDYIYQTGIIHYLKAD